MILGAGGMLGTDLRKTFPDAGALGHSELDITDREQVIRQIKGSRKEYTEADPVGPVNVYGRTKLAGELNIMRAMQNFQIIRTSWLFGANGRNFVDTMLTLSGQMDEVRVVDDQLGKPTYTADLARKTREIIGLGTGVYHATNDGVCSWYEFAGAVIGNVVPCASEEFPRKAKRPRFSVLTNTKTTPMRHWRIALAEYLKTKLVIA